MGMAGVHLPEVFKALYAAAQHEVFEALRAWAMARTGTRLPEFFGALYAAAMAKAGPRMPAVFEALCAARLCQRPSRWPASSRSSGRSGQQRLAKAGTHVPEVFEVFGSLWARAGPCDGHGLTGPDALQIGLLCSSKK